jgi:hypothetical protein
LICASFAARAAAKMVRQPAVRSISWAWTTSTGPYTSQRSDTRPRNAILPSQSPSFARSPTAMSTSWRSDPLPRSVTVDFPTALLRDLLHLSSSVELDEDKLGVRVAALVTALRAAVPSYRGMYLTVVEGDEPVSLSAFHPTEDGAITTSLRLPFAALAAGFHVGNRVVFYAASPGAFVDLAADLGHALHAPIIFDGLRPRLTESPEGDGQHDDGHRDGHESIVLDADLPPATLVSRLTGLVDDQPGGRDTHRPRTPPR